MELQVWFWGLLLMKCLCFIPVACPSVHKRANTEGSGNTQATNSRTQPNLSFEVIIPTQEVRTIKASTIQTAMSIETIRTSNVTRIRPVSIRPAAMMRQTVKIIQGDRTVHQDITTQNTGGRLDYICYTS